MAPFDFEAFVDFARCQRADGSHYGTGGQCRKGREVGARIKEWAKAFLKRSGWGKKENTGGPAGWVSQWTLRADDGLKEGPNVKKLGSGAYGKAYEVGDGIVVKLGKLYPKEVKVMDDLKHIEGIPRVVASKFGAARDKYGIKDPVGIIAMSKSPGKTIQEISDKSKDPSLVLKAWDKAIPILKQIHKKGYAHGDIHSGNVLYDSKSGKASIIDLGEAFQDISKGRFQDIRDIADRVSLWKEKSGKWDKNSKDPPVLSAFIKEWDRVQENPSAEIGGTAGFGTLNKFWDAIPDS